MYRSVSAVGLGLFLALGLSMRARAAEPAFKAETVFKTECQPTAPKLCALVQTVPISRDGKQKLVAVFVRSLENPHAFVFRVITPIGVFLPAGVALKIDGAETARTPYVRCSPEGCAAEAVVDEAVMDKLKIAKELTVVVFETPKSGEAAPISLIGFKGLIDSLP